MHTTDQLRFNRAVFRGQPLRTALLLLAVTIGVASVVMLTSLGEGARRYIDREFASLGTNLLVVFPGRNETTGGQPPMYGTNPRDLTLEDARSMARVPGVEKMAPVIAGTAPVSLGPRSREVVIMGTTAEFFPVRRVHTNVGRPLPPGADREALALCVLGDRVKQELFGNRRALGEWVRIGERRMRVIGVLADLGESLGMDMSDVVLIPVRTAEQLFNTQGLFRVMLETREGVDETLLRTRLREVIRQRHDGEDDITIVSQESVLAAFDSILTTLTLAVAAIAAISLLVAGILIMNISLISVSQRRAEIGLLKAIGASGDQVRRLFLGESLLLTLGGSVLGVVVAYGAVFAVRQVWPVFPLMPPWWAAPAATGTALLAGLVFSWLPAGRAARLDPVLAMQGSGP